MIKYTDDFYPTDNYKWVILDKQKAEELHIELLEIDNESSVLTVDMSYKPKEMSSDEYIVYLQQQGIAINNVNRSLNTKPKTKKNKKSQ